ncbi:RagB/SusD family nutrient uptake outer membrane protein [Rufibacter glacialis]|uniref:RagB/SusD family nutrient uptake outer membrane protein n=1 Tax=Rufibacter glacialis TaxID=1259555 RepID=A0ABV4RB01_9BACT|nr:RagB/SusD family nutrient uptake outer membrane protein [Rufibacter glacialis]GGK67134.1 membrane protein [Rufibacter glacialis]
MAAGLSIFSSACDDFLDVEPTNGIEMNEAITDARSAQRAIQGIYSAFQSDDYYGLSYLFYQDLYADNLGFNGTFTTHREVANRVINPSNLQIADTWTSIYAAIGRANWVIQSVQALGGLTTDEKSAFIAEAKFLRALAYFDLVKVFGGVPIVTVALTNPGDIQNQPRSTQEQVYAFIEQDLMEAEIGLEGTSNPSMPYFASDLAASALLARVYLQQGKWALAAQKATQVISSGKYSLATNFRDIFSSTGNTQNAGTSEVIFELAFSRDDQNALASSSAAPGTLGQRFNVTSGFFNVLTASQNAGDSRVEATAFFDAETNRRKIRKYNDVINNGDNVPILRLAEMYLIRAEANARLAAATAAPTQAVVDDINRIRRRAGLPAVSLATNAAALTEILAQRRIEFAFEGMRFMDLKRYNLTCQVLNFCPASGTSADNSYRNLWPIPLQQIETNPNLAPQNPGY